MTLSSVTSKLALTTQVSTLAGVGPTRVRQLADFGIETISDLLYYSPFRYENIEQHLPIADLKPDSLATFAATVVSKTPIRSPRFKSMIKAKVSDFSGGIELTWFNAPFVLTSLKVGETYFFTGKVTLFKNKLGVNNPLIEREAPDVGALVPIYHESADITSRMLRKWIKTALETTDLSDDVQLKKIYQRHDLDDLNSTLHTLHKPASESDLKAAKQRLAFDEFFHLITDVLSSKKNYQESRSVKQFKVSNDDIKNFAKLLPYELTPSQHQALQAIALDVTQSYPMHRLIQGEVGSGKTTVAAFGLWLAARQNQQSILICPTKILAQQHFQTLANLFGDTINIGLYTGKEKNLECDILVGTHALFNIKNLKPSLVIIDEEHRFGVKQREHFFQLKTKPHFISMTATPIPRTVALTALADRDLSFITPHKSNQNIKTWVVPEGKRASAYTWVNEILNEAGGQQALIICPFIEDSSIETLTTVKSATAEFARLKKVFPKRRLKLLHGRMKDEEKTELFNDMMAGKTDILVTTPVVEVGVDIAKASVIVIEGAERFGLAQLHQLRGRVGRRGQAAYCLLFTSDEHHSTKRLEHFSQTYDGNALAEYDLKHRGSGELLGTRQHGFDTLKFASWTDTKLIETCKDEAEAWLQRSVSPGKI